MRTRLSQRNPRLRSGCAFKAKLAQAERTKSHACLPPLCRIAHTARCFGIRSEHRRIYNCVCCGNPLPYIPTDCFQKSYCHSFREYNREMWTVKKYISIFHSSVVCNSSICVYSSINKWSIEKISLSQAIKEMKISETELKELNKEFFGYSESSIIFRQWKKFRKSRLTCIAGLCATASLMNASTQSARFRKSVCVFF